MRRDSAARNPVFAVLVFCAVVGLCACNGKAATVAPPLTTTSSTVAATTSTMPTTTVYQPSAPQATKDKAGSHLIAAWQANNQAAALTDATPAAVAAVFAQPFPKGGVQSRGCSSAVAGPSFCTYRIFANGNLVEMSASQVPGGWAITAVTIES